MAGLLNVLQGFAVIGIVIAVGYIAARFRIGGPTAQQVLHLFVFFICNPCLLFTMLSKQELSVIFHSSIIVAFLSALIVAAIFFTLNKLLFHMDTANATVGCLNAMYENANNIGLPVATYILGNPALVAPILLMQQLVFTPVALTVLDISTSGKASAKRILTQPLRQPIILGSLAGVIVSWIDSATGVYIVPTWLYDPLHMIGQAAVPLVLMAFGMSLHGMKPPAKGKGRGALVTVVVLKNVVMPLVTFLLAYFMMGYRGTVLYGCVVLSALPCAQNVYNYAARYNTATDFARDGILWTTVLSPIVIAVIAVLLA